MDRLSFILGREHRQPALAFYHVDSSTKTKAVTVLVHNCFSLARVRVEVANCVVLCFNCHQLFHAGWLEF